MNYYWEEQEIITGDNLESLSDCIFDIGNYINGDHGRQKTVKREQDLIDEQIANINFLKPKTLYCYGHDIERLSYNIDKIQLPFTLITHNSDIGIKEEYKPLADNKKIIKWFGQNNSLIHSKTISLPIGIARKKYSHGNTALLSLLSKNYKKKNLVYKNFSIDTNINERSIINQITTQNGIYMSDKCDQYQYLQNISEAVFVISPPGNGIDCHRIWECLYLKSIPIVQYHHTFEQFKHLPILFIDSWNDVTRDYLIDQLHLTTKIADKNELLNFNYWKKLIL